MVPEPEETAMTHDGPPKHSVILCHPEPDSFNAAVAARYCSVVRAIGHEVVLRDLYGIGFDPVLRGREQPGRSDFLLGDDVADELELLAGTSIFVFVYPVWFGTPPAMLKGYVERVLGAGFSHRAVRERAFHPLADGAHLLSFTSSGATQQWLSEQGALSSLRQVFDHYLKNGFSFASADHVHFSALIEGTGERYVRECLANVEEKARWAASVAGREMRRPGARKQVSTSSIRDSQS
jgi:NAD(P)H dehydrogenase (quinone)